MPKEQRTIILCCRHHEGKCNYSKEGDLYAKHVVIYNGYSYCLKHYEKLNILWQGG